MIGTDSTPVQARTLLVKYEILAPITGPNERTAWLKSIWIILTGERRPRLVTLVPEDPP